jgi:hypothetical protein
MDYVIQCEDLDPSLEEIVEEIGSQEPVKEKTYRKNVRRKRHSKSNRGN